MKAKDTKAPALRSLDQTASFFEVSTVTVNAWIKAGCPVVTKGGPGTPYELDLEAVANWKNARAAEEADAALAQAERDQQLKLELLGDDALSVDPNAPATLTKSEQRAALEAEVARVKLAAMRRELIPAFEVKLALAQILGELRDRLRTLADDVAAEQGLDETTAAAIGKFVDAALHGAADEIEKLEAPATPDQEAA